MQTLIKSFGKLLYFAQNLLKILVSKERKLTKRGRYLRRQGAKHVILTPLAKSGLVGHVRTRGKNLDDSCPMLLALSTERGGLKALSLCLLFPPEYSK